MKKTLLAFVSISVAAFAYANTTSDSSELLSQQCKNSAEAVSTLKNLQYGNTWRALIPSATLLMKELLYGKTI